MDEELLVKYFSANRYTINNNIINTTISIGINKQWALFVLHASFGKHLLINLKDIEYFVLHNSHVLNSKSFPNVASHVFKHSSCTYFIEPEHLQGWIKTKFIASASKQILQFFSSASVLSRRFFWTECFFLFLFVSPANV